MFTFFFSKFIIFRYKKLIVVCGEEEKKNFSQKAVLHLQFTQGKFYSETFSKVLKFQKSFQSLATHYFANRLTTLTQTKKNRPRGETRTLAVQSKFQMRNIVISDPATFLTPKFRPQNLHHSRSAININKSLNIVKRKPIVKNALRNNRCLTSQLP